MRKLFMALCITALLSAVATAAATPKETVRLPGLKAPVTVTYDTWGLPHIKAAGMYDLFFAQGWVQARDRLWQMDMNRRRANGRMAELRGQGSVGQDFDSYRAQLPQVSKKIWDTAGREERLVLQAYSDGVNAYIAELKELPEEYKKIGAKPLPWTPVDSVAAGRSVAWVMSSDLGVEIAVGMIAKKLGKSLLMRVLPMDPVDPTTVTEEKSSFPVSLLDDDIWNILDQPLFTRNRPLFEPPYGSNNWVVSGKRAAGGRPLLSNDTHMGLPNPAEWYEIHLEAPGINVIGMTYPSVPGIMAGHNDRIAWGVTTSRFDVTDVYIEKLDPANPKTNYIYKGESLPFREEKIDIPYSSPEGMKTETRILRHTVHGPVVYEDGPQSVLSYRWTGHEPTHEAEAFLGFMKARNLNDFKKALDRFEVGCMNFVYADVAGNIYYRGMSKVPIREGTPYLPLDGSTDKYEWKGYIPYDKLPHAENPAKGFIASANNRQAGRDYPYYLGMYYDKGYRARRISDLLAADKRVTFEKMQKIQADVYSLPGERMTPMLFKAAEKHPELLTDDAKAALAILKKWDFKETIDAIGPSVFYKWLKFTVRDTFADDVPEEVIGNLGRSEVAFAFLLNTKKSPIDFYDDKRTPGVQETKEMIIAKALGEAVNELREQLGPDMAQWKWRRIHQVTLDHSLGGEFNLGPYEADGGMDTVNVADFGLLGKNFNFGHGPSMRFTAEMIPGAVRGANIIAGGQSGDRKSPHYSDQMPLWLAKKTHPLWFSAADIKRNAERVTVLRPK